MTPQVREIALSFYEGLGTPRALSSAMLLAHGEWDQLVSQRVDPLHYVSDVRYQLDAAAVDFLRKCDGLDTSFDQEQAAKDKWWQAERQCFKTNQRLYPLVDNFGIHPSEISEPILDLVSDVKKWVGFLIGDGPPQQIEGKFGPGATMSDPSHRSNVCDKMLSEVTLTHDAWPYLLPWTGTRWATSCCDGSNSIAFVEGNTFFTVLKDSSTYRSCGKEPSLNVFNQLALGSVMRARLRQAGWDLNVAKDVHARVARFASKTGNLSTIDLSSASDTIATALVRLVVPPRWFAALDDLRSKKTRIDGRWVVLEKFSSMGNGFTFELETAIFMAICLACCGRTDPWVRPGRGVWTNGDDIIVPSRDSEVVLAVLKWFGFTPNERKTFTSGPFRESCGGDFFDGVAVRPFYLEKLPSEPQEFISLANGIHRFAHQNAYAPGLWAGGLRTAWFKCLDMLPKHIRECRGPSFLGDIVIHDENPQHWRSRWQDGIRYVRCYYPVRFRGRKFRSYPGSTQLGYILYGGALLTLNQQGFRVSQDTRGAYEAVPFRDNVSGYSEGWVSAS